MNDLTMAFFRKTQVSGSLLMKRTDCEVGFPNYDRIQQNELSHLNFVKF